jgi:hypothetical protein
MRQGDGGILRRLLVHSMQTYAAARAAVKPIGDMARQGRCKCNQIVA